MPRHQKTDAEPPAKRVKLGNKGEFKFSSADEIRKALRTEDQSSLTEALTALRNQFTVKPNEVISSNDDRLLLAQHWMQHTPGAQDMFDAWEGSNQRQMSLSALFVSVLASLLVLLSTHYTYQPLGYPIIKTLLSPQWMRRVNTNLSGTHNELILVTLKLLNAMSAFAGGRERKSVSEAFAWETKSLSKILYMRRKSKNDAQIDILARPDIRTLYVQFILSFVDQETSTVVKSVFLEQHRDVFLSIFKGIVQDPYPIIHKIFEVCWTGIWTDHKIKRTLKIGLFNESTIFQLIKLYDRITPESADADHIPADLVHHFLLAICTCPGVGICFKDRGWYPRDSDGDDGKTTSLDSESTTHRSGKIYNKILANLLKTLKVNNDSRQQELALKIMTSCPELVAGYWTGAALTLEPRLSSTWIANVSFFGSVISLPVPLSSFLLPSSSLFHPSPPPLQIILENILPNVNTKNNMSKGLQSTSSLVQHCTALALAKCLAKYAEVLRIFDDVQRALEEDEDGQWCNRQKEIEKEVRRRVPDFQVIIGFSQQKLFDSTAQLGDQIPSSGQISLTKIALLSESAQRLLWLYHRCLSSLVAEARFDVGKLLLNFTATIISDKTKHAPGEAESNVVANLRTIQQLHILRLLKESDQFVWSGKPPSSPYSYLYILLRAYNTTEVLAIRLAITSLLKGILSDSILFQEDAEEVYLWLDSLPTTRRAPGAEAPDGAMLTDEGSSVLEFLDDCVQRCLKTPYRYLEEKDALVRSVLQNFAEDEENMAISDHHDLLCSPVLITVLDQLGAKVASNLLTPSDVLAITTFIRKLAFSLSSKQHSLVTLTAFVDKIDLLVHPGLFPQYPNITTAIRAPQPHHKNPVVQDFLNQIDQVPIPVSVNARAISAYELSDWVRLTDYALHPSQLDRLASIIYRFHPLALRELFHNLSPGQGSVWDVASVRQELLQGLRFDWLFISTTPTIMEDGGNRDILVDSLFTPSVTLTHIQRAICLITHSLASVQDRHSVQRDLLLLSASIVQKARASLSGPEFASLKVYIFGQCPHIKDLLFSQSLEHSAREGLEHLIDISLDFGSEDDRKIAVEFGVYWMNVVKDNLASQDNLSTFALPWLRFLEPDDLFSLLIAVSDDVNSPPKLATLELLETILAALKTCTIANPETLGPRLGQLLVLRSLLQHSSSLEDMIAEAVSTCLPVAHHGRPSDSPASDLSSLELSTTFAELRWNHHLDCLPKELDIQTFLMQQSWRSSTVRIVSDLLYKQPSSRQTYLGWLSAGHHMSVDSPKLAATFHAYLDAAVQQADAMGDPECEILASQFFYLLSSNQADSSRAVLSTCATLLFSIIKRSSSKFQDHLCALLRHIQSLPNGQLDSGYLALGRRLRELFHHEAEDIVTCMVDNSLQQVVRIFSSATEELENTLKLTDELVSLVKPLSHIKSHLAEPVVTSVIQNQLSNINALRLVAILVRRAQLKPASVNRHLQSIVQSPQFFKICAASSYDDLHPRDAVVELLLTLFNLHPNNTCQPSHIEPLVHIYGGTLSSSDRQILSIFQLFELQRKTSVASIIGRWSASLDATSSTFLEALQTLDSIRVLRTCLVYPTRRSFAEEVDDSLYDGQIYDPVFVMLLFGHMISHSPPGSALAWVELFRTNVVSLLIRALSSKDQNMRNVALCQITTLWKCLEMADMQEKPHVFYILSQLKDTLPPPSDQPVRRLPSYSTLILLHALRGVFYPSNFIYPLTARFLLQRPELDTHDVPMLYSMLYNSTDDWKKERGWIIRFLSDGMTSTEDWRVLKGRHTWEIMSSLFQSSETDYALRNGTLEVLANLTCNTQAATSLVLKSALLTWIEMQLQSVRGNEVIAWLKILENILTVVDPAKLETLTGGEWRFVLCRSLLLMVSPNELVSVTLRLSLLPGPPIPHLSLLVDRLLGTLKSFEKDMRLPLSYHAVQSQKSHLHGAHGLLEAPSSHDPMQIWGEGVEALWRIAMTFERKIPAWDVLTCRLLLWRSVAGEDGSVVGEWARREVIRNLRM